MRRTWLSSLIVALLLGASSPSWMRAAEPSKDLKPLLVVSAAAYDETKADLAYIGELAGNPDLPKALDALVIVLTGGRGIQGIDTSRPAGAIVYCTGEKPCGYAFVPVTDVNKLRESLAPHIREVTELDGGVYKIEGRHQPKPGYVKEKNGWLYIADNAEVLGQTPDDPLPQLDGLNKQYDLAVRVYPGNVPEDQREKLLNRVREQGQRRLERLGGKDEEVRAIREAVAKRLFRAVRTAVNELDQVTIGWSLDREAQRALLEVTATAREGTELAKRMAEGAKAKSRFAGFRMEGAAVAGNWVGDCPPLNREGLDRFFDALGNKISEKIDAKIRKEERAKAVKQFVGGMLEVGKENMAAGHADGGFSLLMKPNAVTFVSGKFVANANKLEETLGQAVEAIRKEHPDLVNKVLKEDAEQYKDVRMHVLSLPVPPRCPNREKVVQAVGEQVEVVFGIGEKATYLAAGRDAVKTLKQAIDQSVKIADVNQHVPGTVPPVAFTCTLGEFARFAAAMGNERECKDAQEALAAMEKAPGKDHVHLTATSSERGTRIRLEIEPGALRAIALGQPLHRREH